MTSGVWCFRSRRKFLAWGAVSRVAHAREGISLCIAWSATSKPPSSSRGSSIFNYFFLQHPVILALQRPLFTTKKSKMLQLPTSLHRKGKNTATNNPGHNADWQIVLKASCHFFLLSSFYRYAERRTFELRHPQATHDTHSFILSFFPRRSINWEWSGWLCAVCSVLPGQDGCFFRLRSTTSPASVSWRLRPRSPLNLVTFFRKKTTNFSAPFVREIYFDVEFTEKRCKGVKVTFYRMVQTARWT